MIETWKDIPEYKGLYQVSDNGRVRSIERRVHRNGITSKSLKSKVLQPQKNTNGYLFVCLSKQGHVRQFRVHRLVATVFIVNPNNLPEVNHINENKEDNSVQNLEWVDRKTNCQHGTRNKRTVAKRNQSGHNNGMWGRRGAKSPRAKIVHQYSLNNEFIRSWNSVVDAANSLKLDAKLIYRTAKGHHAYAYGFKWSYDQNK